MFAAFARLSRPLIALMTLLALAPRAAEAGALPKFSGLVVFGDSLSDTGNFAAATRAKYSLPFPGPLFDYARNRFTNGPQTIPAARAYTGVWHQQLAWRFLHLPAAKDSTRGGSCYAFGEAETGGGTSTIASGELSISVKNLGQQVDDYLAAQTPDAQALHIIWCGSNDLFADSSADQVATAVQNVVGALTELEQAGARKFMVVNLPPLGDTPGYREDATQAAQLDAAAASFNAQLSTALDSAEASFPNTDAVKIYRLNVSVLFAKIAAHPRAHGFRNIHGSAQAKPVNPDRWLFWDDVHPTTMGHHLVAVAAKNLLRSP